MFEYKWITDGNLFLNLVVHRINVSLVHTHTLLSKGGSVVYRDVM